jgi:hypothetical protein
VFTRRRVNGTCIRAVKAFVFRRENRHIVQERQATPVECQIKTIGLRTRERKCIARLHMGPIVSRAHEPLRMLSLTQRNLTESQNRIVS